MSESLSIIHLGAPGEEISLKDLRAISERFKKLHQLKRDSIRQVLNISQRQFLDALPLILNANHPALPGFISSTTPAGIFAYHPDKRSIQAARQLNHSFSHKPRKYNDNYAI
ncbi:MAG: adenylate cyclase, partial [Methylococcaceae bacterium]|nr:adenylate cyclase [Methylococcaceae bacterium]